MNKKATSTQNRFAALTENSMKISEKDFQAFMRLRKENTRLIKENTRLTKEAKAAKNQSVKDTLRKKELLIALKEKVYSAQEVEDNILRNINIMHNVEMKAIEERLTFFKLLMKRVKQTGRDVEVNLFGGFPRRALQQRSMTKSEHTQFMTGLEDSDLDIRIYYSKCSDSNLVSVLQDIADYGLKLNPLNLEVHQLREITSITGEITQHAKCSFKFKGKIIKADIFNKYYINFSHQDYSVNQISISQDGITLNQDRNAPWVDMDREYGIETLEALIQLQKKEATPLFLETTETTELKKQYLNNMGKMVERQNKMINEGFKLSREIIPCDKIDACTICWQSYKEDTENPDYIPPKRFNFALCGCSFGKSICRCCFKKWNKCCPQCKTPWKVAMTKQEEDEDSLGLILPQIERIQLQGEVDIYGNLIDNDDISSDIE